MTVYTMARKMGITALSLSITVQIPMFGLALYSPDTGPTPANHPTRPNQPWV
ncbi:MAG: hypothetical protein IPK03_01105 [Bacteroidetes bacterium]|nr:hypothetical protein [Bacteroidota bacterium]